MLRKFSSFIFCIILCSQSFAKDLFKEHKSDLLLIENYLNDIKSLEANFVQEDNNGKLSQGKLWLLRPGKLRIEYGKPNPLLIIVNGSVLAYTDIELEETSYLTTNSTPASFLTRANFSFLAKDVEIIGFDKNDKEIKVSIMKKNKKEAGVFSLIFKTNPIRFVEIDVQNDLDEITKVFFTTSKFGGAISDKIFVVKNKNLPQ